MLNVLDNFTRILSRSWGELAKIEKPYPVVQKIIRQYAQIYKVNLEEIEKPVGAYRSLSDFFTRKLKSSARPIQGDFVHPCDGVLLGKQDLDVDGNIIVKGRSYSIKEFIPENPWSHDIENMQALVYYLSPKDYHRFHSPLNAQIKWLSHIPGGLYPVNNLGFKLVPDLYIKNERIVLGLESQSKKYFLSFVGATNVGSIVLPWDDVETNHKKISNVLIKDFSPAKNISVGEELGYFNMGSSIVFIIPKSVSVVSRPGPVKMGELL